MNRLEFITYKPTKEEMEMHKQKLLEEERIQYIINHKKELEANTEDNRRREVEVAIRDIREMTQGGEIYPGAVIPTTRPRRSREEPPSAMDSIRGILI